MGRESRPHGPQLEGSPGAGPRQGAGGAAGQLGTCPPRALQTARVRVSFLSKWWIEHGSHILFRGSYAGAGRTSLLRQAGSPRLPPASVSRSLSEPEPPPAEQPGPPVPVACL